MASNPVVRTSNHKPTANSVVCPSEVGNENTEVRLEGKSGDVTGPHQLSSCRAPSSHKQIKTKPKSALLLSHPHMNIRFSGCHSFWKAFDLL